MRLCPDDPQRQPADVLDTDRLVPVEDRCVARAVLRQEVLEEDVAEDVETNLAAQSQGQMRVACQNSIRGYGQVFF